MSDDNDWETKFSEEFRGGFDEFCGGFDDLKDNISLPPATKSKNESNIIPLLTKTKKKQLLKDNITRKEMSIQEQMNSDPDSIKKQKEEDTLKQKLSDFEHSLSLFDTTTNDDTKQNFQTMAKTINNFIIKFSNSQHYDYFVIEIVRTLVSQNNTSVQDIKILIDILTITMNDKIKQDKTKMKKNNNKKISDWSKQKNNAICTSDENISHDDDFM